VTGTINPIEEMAHAAHKVGAVIVIDGAQSAPHMKIDVTPYDFYAFSAHKCYGPTGVGILYGKNLANLSPRDGGGGMIETVAMEQSTYTSPPLRFEAGTPNIADVIAFRASLAFLEGCHLEPHLLEAATHAVLQAGGKILGTAPHKGPILTFTIDGVHPLDMATLLDLSGVQIRSGHLCAQPLLRRFGLESAMRVSLGLYNTEEDIEIFSKALLKATTKAQKFAKPVA
jgi:cysteine desulfurase/selenocysteine lyase